MTRAGWMAAVGLAVAVATPALWADVKTQEKVTFKMEGFLGGLMNRAMGGADGKTSTLSLKGDRLAQFIENTGSIVDLKEERIYSVDLKKKEYSVITFAEMRAQIEKARQDLAKQQAEMNPEDKQQASDAAKQLELDVDVKQTGQRKSVAGHDASETVLTLTLREKGKTLEEGGGFVMTSNIWLGPRVAALDELAEFRMRQFKAIYGQAFDAQQLNAAAVMIPGLGRLMERMASESHKLTGTPLATTSIFETVKSAEQMKAAASNASSSGSGGGGLGGMLARRMAGNRGEVKQRSLALTTTSETLSIGTTVAGDDVAIPAAFKLKK